MPIVAILRAAASRPIRPLKIVPTVAQLTAAEQNAEREQPLGCQNGRVVGQVASLPRGT